MVKWFKYNQNESIKYEHKTKANTIYLMDNVNIQISLSIRFGYEHKNQYPSTRSCPKYSPPHPPTHP